MKLLAFDTSTEVMSIAVQNGEQVFTHSGAGGAHTSATLIPAIQSLMQQAGLQFAQLDAIAFGRGPGSFTGLRTACSVAQGLAFAAKVKVLPMDTLMVLANEAEFAAPASGAVATTGKPRVVCAALDARMGELYYAYYAFSAGTCQALSQAQLHTPAAMAVMHGFEGTLLAGNVRPAYDAQLSPAMLAAPYRACLPSASAMLRLAPQRIAAGALVNAQDALPLYIRDKVAQTTAEREGAAAIAAKPVAAQL
jgi:tRNA threonylcarbamoyladenosine biosynthesis protein TsaB